MTAVMELVSMYLPHQTSAQEVAVAVQVALAVTECQTPQAVREALHRAAASVERQRTTRAAEVVVLVTALLQAHLLEAQAAQASEAMAQVTDQTQPQARSIGAAEVVALPMRLIPLSDHLPQAAPASSSSATQDLLALLGVQFRKQADTPFTPSQPAEHLRFSR